ncbi:GNAT family N-acetyltransferase [Chelatococcus asaccharovorans]|uniref:GNAT family N-acetyltransferase n=1 Tax=Chelatococcus asaccharovorans TaxID=28210 RepID=UPI00224C6F53|nr:GNAT family N-acetyltransferase [Chelatococcus asaccharovorans]CAH1660635.1 Acetyltransferase (GNAT) family protein [Chelatococcus asaccharovorans]CAH1683727.1 Acetyltransferase (GNAT) family protein [Chelatococcus asaccharovorans]
MAWDACLPGEVEDHAYYRACEEAAAASGIGLRMAAIVVEQSEEVVAVAPLFRLNYRLDMPLQGRLRRLGEALFRRLPGVLTLQTLCVGSPYSERCHLGFSPRLDTVGRIAALECMIATLQRQAAAERVQLLVWKDLSPGQEQDAATLLNRARFARLASLPIAVLDLPYTDEAAYLASLSPATRKDIRRKLAKAGAVRLEYRSDIAGLEGEIDTLYESTRRQSALDYRDLELLPPGYFAAISPALGERAVFALYWVGTELVAFNLLLVEADRVIDKFLGMRYPLAREHNIYAVSWMANVRFCITRGISLLQSGQTAYASKLRFGSSLVTSTVYVRHCNTPLQWVLRRLSPWLGFDRFDPDLAEWARRGRLREGAKTYSKLRQRNERAV